MINRKSLLFVGATFLTFSAAAIAQGGAGSTSSQSSGQTTASGQSGQSGSQGGAQGSASSQTNANVQKNKSGAQASGSNSTSANAQSGKNSGNVDSGSTMNAVLNHPVDAKKNKPGDEVTAKTTQNMVSNGQVVIPKGSTLKGHVTQAQAREKGQSESTLGIVFDRVEMKHGQEMPVNFAVQALAAGQSATSSNLGPDTFGTMGSATGSGSAMGSTSGGGRPMGGGSAGGGLVGGVTSTTGGVVGSTGNVGGNVGGTTNGAVGSTVRGTTGTAGGVTSGVTGSASNSTSGALNGTVGGLNSAGQLTSNSQGVFGLQGLGLNSAASNTTQGSLITSTSRNVHLDQGTRMLLVAQGQSQTQVQGSGH